MTTKATVFDVTMMMCIQEYLDERNLKPAEHFIDGGYISAKSFVDSEEMGIEVVGPISEISNWQSKVERGLTADQFRIDWEQAYVECPAGKRSISWRDSIKDGKPVINVRFGKLDCQGCLFRERCTRSKTAGRTLQLKEQKTHELMARMRLKSKESNMKQRYQIRSGIESTISQGVRGFGLRFSRYIGLEKTALQHALTAAAINMERLAIWWSRPQRALPKRPPSALGRLLSSGI